MQASTCANVWRSVKKRIPMNALQVCVSMYMHRAILTEI